MNQPENPWKGRRILITGVCGTVGRELLRQVLVCDPAEIIGLDNNESALFLLKQSRGLSDRVRFYVGDVKDKGSLSGTMAGVDIVLHTAAYKHVEMCESSPRETVANNVGGIQNVIEAATDSGVSRVLFTSTDKAVNPTSVMGTSKLMGERLMVAADVNQHGNEPLFMSTRFGNVLGSRGSVIPVFAKQVRDGGPVTLTDPQMTRFIMSLDEAVKLVMGSVSVTRGGEVFVTKMPTVRIEDLAAVMIEELAPLSGKDPSDIAIEVIGTKPGEKIYEELMNEEEARRAIELEDYFVVLPALRSPEEQNAASYRSVVGEHVTAPYNSSNQPAMTREELRGFLRKHDLLGLPPEAERGQPV